MTILKRKHARIALVCTLLALAMMILLVAAIQKDASTTVVSGAAVAFILLMAVGSAVTSKTLKCPYCGKSKAMATWNPSKYTQRCRKCGKPLFFDDEIKPEDAAQFDVEP